MAELAQRSLSAVWHPCTQMKQHERFPLVAIERAEGAWLYEADGHRLLDAVSSWWVNLLGHGQPDIKAALHDQLEKLEHVMLAGFTHEPVVALSERLARLAPGDLGHCFYASDGASAVEIALKMSFHFWANRGGVGKTRFAMLENGYHGETLGALSVTDIASFRSTYAPLLPAADRVPTPAPRQGESRTDAAERAAAALARHFERHAERTAALIVEPLVQCAGGMAMYDAEYLRAARKLCTRFRVHLIADEIAVGFGRTGTFFASEQADIVPDFLCLSKGVTGGFLPLSLVMTTPEVYAAFYDDRIDRGFLHSHSYSGNALACRAAVAVLDVLARDRVLERNRATCDWTNRRCETLRSHPAVRDFRNTGMIWAFEAADLDLGPAFCERARRAGVLLRPLGNTIYWMPPYCVGMEEMEFLVTAVEKLLLP
ncbi:MAG TPA: adenosylmethionine--8-amino-7-oxononanoate transaminase [Burkholderiales bacterium]